MMMMSLGAFQTAFISKCHTVWRDAVCLQIFAKTELISVVHKKPCYFT